MNLGILRLTGKIELQSPLLIGSGESETSDIDIMRDSEGKPFIPASSFIGVIKSHINDNFEVDNIKNKLNNIWGYTNKQEAMASSILCSDLYLLGDEKPTEIRDGIAIDPKTGIVLDKHKFDYEIVPKGAEFQLKIDAPYRENKEIIENLFATIISELTNSHDIRFGAKSNNGLGKVKLKNQKLIDYNFADYKNFIAYLNNEDAPRKELAEGFKKNHNKFSASLELKIKNSFIQRAYPTESTQPDSVNIKSGGEYVMTGSGAKGAIRNRALRIVNTLLESNTEEPQFIKNLFGFVTKQTHEKLDHNKKSSVGRVRIEETKIATYIETLQNRIAMDRFTGGTMKAALFDSLALFYDSIKDQTGEMPSLKLDFSIKDCSEAEAGLMLLIIKDIWTGDLAIGGEKSIGRGVFEGLKLSLDYAGESCEIKSSETAKFAEYQKYVDSLLKELGVSNEK